MPQVPTKINERDQAEMVWVPPGPFLMGDDKHTVKLPGYWIYKYPVTQLQFRRYCTANGVALPEVPSWGWRADHPVVYVSWNDAMAYCRWAGVDLPTEEEWEKAARGMDGREYPWGDTWEADRCRCSLKVWEDARSTSPVTTHPSGVSPFGAYDMAGNVDEWCQDWFDKDEEEDRAVRGGAWNYNHRDYFRCAARNRNQPDFRYDVLGCRCVFRPGSS